ncbi:MAG: ABC transporter permease subunit [Elusimicrobia bacterium]|nr:ABC transporter permease subunit [Elusimicrobiota bacterium]
MPQAPRSLPAFALALAALLASWEALARLGAYPPHLFPPPTRVAAALERWAASGELWLDLKASGLRWGLGFALGGAAGAVLGAATGAIGSLRVTVGPLLNLFRTTPLIMLIPLAMLWFGLGELEKIFLVAWGTLFPVWLNTQAGILSAEREYLWAAQCLGARGLRLHWEVSLPRCLPFLLAGVRVAVSTATFALAAAEMAGAFEGLTHRVLYSHQMFETDKMMAGIVVIAALGLALDRSFVRLSRWAWPWLEDDHDGA